MEYRSPPGYRPEDVLRVSTVSGCADAGLHKILVRYSKTVLVVDTVDECLSKWCVVEERLEWEIIFRSFDGCESTLNDWEKSLSSVDAGRGDA